MTFGAYIRNIHAKTGKGPDEFRALAEQQGFMQSGTLRTDVKVGLVVTWLKSEFNLGHGHAMAIVAVLKQPGRQQ